MSSNVYLRIYFTKSWDDGYSFKKTQSCLLIAFLFYSLQLPVKINKAAFIIGKQVHWTGGTQINTLVYFSTCWILWWQTKLLISKMTMSSLCLVGPSLHANCFNLLPVLYFFFSFVKDDFRKQVNSVVISESLWVSLSSPH